MPAIGQYEDGHSKAWSQTVRGYDGFIFVFPQYNWGYPAVLKNALDFLYDEWSGKPVSFATYGTHGGNRAAKQLQGVLAGLHMRELYHHLEIVITIDDVDSEWQLKDLEAVLNPHRERIGAIGRQMLEALDVPGTRGRAMTRGVRAALVAIRRARIYAAGFPQPRRRSH